MLKFAVVSKKSSHLGRFLGNLAYFGVNFLLLCYFFGITIFFFKYSLEFCLVCFILKTMFFRLRNKKYLKKNICSRFCHFAGSCLFLIRFFLFIFITALLVFVSIAFFFGLNQMFFSFRFDYPMKNVALLITAMLGLCAGKDKISLKISKCSVMNFINILQAPCAKKFHIKKAASKCW